MVLMGWERKWLGFFWLACVAALGGAIISQFVFGMQPCHLCLLQRWPYSIAILFLTPLLFYRKLSAERFPVILGVIALLMLSDAGIAGYHAGVEQGWWIGPGDCTSSSAPDSLEDLRKAVMEAPAVRCDLPAFVFLGLSMAAWNFCYALGIFILAVIGIRKWQNKAQK